MKKSELQLLEGKVAVLEVEKIKIEDEVKVLKKRNQELEELISKNVKEKVDGGVVDLMGSENDKALQLMIENKVLDCEKRKAESDLEVWKIKCIELQSRVAELERTSEEKFLKCSLCGVREVCQGSAEMGEANGQTDNLRDTVKSVCSQNGYEREIGGERARASACSGYTSSFSNKGTAALQESGTPSAELSFKHYANGDKRNGSTSFDPEIANRSRVRKRLAFVEKESPHKKMAPSNPAGVIPAFEDVIDIDDSDDEKKTTKLDSIPQARSTDCELDCSLKENKVPAQSNSRLGHAGQSNEDGYEGNLSFISTPRRKNRRNIVNSDADSDDNDDIPISCLRKNRSKEQKTDSRGCKYDSTHVDSSEEVGEPVSGHRLRRLRKCEDGTVTKNSAASHVNGNGRKYCLGVPTDETVEDGDGKEDSSDSEGDSLGGFIVSNSDESDSDGAADSDGASSSNGFQTSSNISSDSEDASDGKLDYKEIISRIRRTRNQKVNWEFEADMLADFGKDPELCMRAVCALYRQQTSDEKIAKGTFVVNGRGFSQCDAPRGSKLAEFLIGKDPQGDLQKSVKEFAKRDPKGLEKCRQLASRYSKQLFEIYKNGEDPLFLPS